MYEDMEFYFLCRRNPEIVFNFIKDEFLVQSWSNVFFPMHSSEPEEIFTDSDKLIAHLLSAKPTDYKKFEFIVYFKKAENDCGGMYIVGFCGDGHLVFGVPPLGRTPDQLGDYAKRYNGIYGYMSPAYPETESAEKFRWSAPVLYKNGEMVVVGYPEEFDDGGFKIEAQRSH